MFQPCSSCAEESVDTDSCAVFGCFWQVLEVVRSNYDTLTLKLQDGLDQYERYSEQHKEAAFFKELVSCLTSEQPPGTSRLLRPALVRWSLSLLPDLLCFVVVNLYGEKLTELTAPTLITQSNFDFLLLLRGP